jgi:hypothetical protein
MITCADLQTLGGNIQLIPFRFRNIDKIKGAQIR